MSQTSHALHLSDLNGYLSSLRTLKHTRITVAFPGSSLGRGSTQPSSFCPQPEKSNTTIAQGKTRLSLGHSAVLLVGCITKVVVIPGSVNSVVKPGACRNS